MIASPDAVAVVVADPTTSVADIEALTVPAYEKLALEYDSEEHRTTRILERESVDSIETLLERYPRLRQAEKVLEVGCGTGNLTRVILSHTPATAELVLLDSSKMMLKLAEARLSAAHRRTIKFRQASILSDVPTEALGKFDLVVCGLADPYFVVDAVYRLRRLTKEDGFLIVSLPEKAWTVAERRERLDLPSNQTRFRLASGEVLKAYSFSYFEEELKDLLAEADFQTQEMLVNTSSLIDSGNSPQVSVPIGTISVLARAI